MTHNSLRILHVTAPAGFGGLESVVEMLARGFRERSHDVSVLAIVEDGDASAPFFELLDKGSIPHFCTTIAPRAYQMERRAVRNLIGSYAPHIVHTHGYRTDLLDSGVALSAGVAAVSTAHGFTGVGGRNSLYEWLQLRAIRRLHRVAAVSRSVANRLKLAGVARQKIHIIRNSYRSSSAFLSREEARALLDMGRDAFSVGWIGRLSHEKGPDVMLDAAILVNSHGISVSFIGDGPLMEPLKTRARIAAGPQLIRFHGALPDAASLLKAFDVLAISSRTEGSPIVLLEAIDAGVPVVATAVGGIPDIISENEAVLVAPEDGSALAAAILQLQQNPARATQLAAAARERVGRELGFDSWLDSYEEMYRAAIADRAAGA